MLRSRYIQFPVVRDSSNPSAPLFALSNASFVALLFAIILKLPSLATSATTVASPEDTTVSSALAEKAQLRAVIRIGNVIIFICTSNRHKLFKLCRESFKKYQIMILPVQFIEMRHLSLF